MLAIIGGTGLYNLKGLEIINEVFVETPFGDPTAPVTRARYQDKELLFLPRHGQQHQYLPHEINYRANIFALKKLGARQVIGFSATGSLREEIKPGDLVIPSQYFDFVQGNRNKTFFGKGLAAHISTARPTCIELTKWVSKIAIELGYKLHTGKVYACIDGPRLGTKIESHFLRMVGCDLVGMTNIPEVFLAREAQLCYVTVGIVTDYDCWMNDPAEQVSVANVIVRYGESLKKVQDLLLNLLAVPLPPTSSECRQALKDALLTPEDAIPLSKQDLFDVLRK